MFIPSLEITSCTFTHIYNYSFSQNIAKLLLFSWQLLAKLNLRRNASVQLECGANCLSHGLDSYGATSPSSSGFPAVSTGQGRPFKPPRRLWSAAAAPDSCRASWCNTSTTTTELHSPTSALQNACCGCTGAQLHASASSSARHSSSSSASAERMPLTENGILVNTAAGLLLLLFLQPLRLRLRRCVAE